MVKRSRIPRIFFGWWIVLASGVLAFWGQGLGTFGFSALFKPIALELGFSRAVTSVAPSITRFEGGFLSPVVGWIIDKFGPRWMVFSGVLMVGLSLILMNFVNSLWAFYLVWGVLLGIGINVGMQLALDKAITDWFVKKRGRALSIKWGFFAMAAVLVLPLVGWLVSIEGWRMTCVILGVVMLVVGIPLAWFFVKQHRPEYYGLLPDGAITQETVEITEMIDRGVKYATEVEEVEFTLRQALRTSTYWLFLLAGASISFVAAILVIHVVPLLTDMGVDPVKAAVMAGIMGIGSIPATFISGWLADRVKKQRLRFILGGALLLEVFGFTAFLLNQNLTMLYTIFILHHFAGGIWGPFNGIIIARYFGRKAIGSIRGFFMMFVLPATIAAPIYAGWAYDTTGNYITVFIQCAALLTFATVVVSLAFAPKPPTQVTGIHEIV